MKDVVHMMQRSVAYRLRYLEEAEAARAAHQQGRRLFVLVFATMSSMARGWLVLGRAHILICMRMHVNTPTRTHIHPHAYRQVYIYGIRTMAIPDVSVPACEAPQKG